MKIELLLADDAMPRTVYWEKLLTAVHHVAQPAASATDAHESIFMPHEDLAMETNWPRYARGDSSYVRGEPHAMGPGSNTFEYLNRILQWAAEHPQSTVLLINMHPFFRLPLYTRELPNVIVADGSLSQFERCFNGNTISMPALPINEGQASADEARPIKISFMGVASHPVRNHLANFHNGKDVIVKLIDKTRHDDLQLDASQGRKDEAYEALLRDTSFALVPRGDALFSYRLLEVMSYGCIPIIVSDGWVLPFDRTIDWATFCYVIHHEGLNEAINVLMNIDQEEIFRRQKLVIAAYRQYFGSIENILRTTVAEMARI